MKPFRVAFTVALLLLTFAVLAAAGGKPIIQIAPFTTPFVTSAADSGCGFDILTSPQAGRPNRERTITFSNTQITAGPLFVTLQNLTTNKTVNENISGPGTFTFSDNTFVLRGPSFVVLPVSVAQAAGLPMAFLTNGLLTLTFDEQGNITSASLSGTARDVCPLLE
jgi:hypothetical protein